MTTPTLFRPAAWPEPQTERLVDAAGTTWRVLRAIALELWRLLVATGRALGRVPAECWPPILVTGLAGVLGVAALAGFLADPRSLGEVGWSILSGLLVFVVIMGVAALGLKSGARGFSSHGHAHVHHFSGRDGGREALMRHEKAHQRVGARVGAGGSTVRIWPEKGGWSGVTHFHDPRKLAKLTPEKSIAISVAGIMAAPNTDSPTDMPHAKATAKTTSNPGKAMREGKRIARRYI